jgi:S-ribosylhomocysteine lyase LuxS involved in autoinducer biosynthesis
MVESIKKQLSEKINKAIIEMVEAEANGNVRLTNDAIIEMMPVGKTTFYQALKGECSTDSMLAILKALNVKLI